MELSAVSSRLGKKTVELHGVSKSFAGRTVLRDFDLMLLREDRIGVVGRNGSGKSTLLNLIAGRLMPDSGEVATGKTVRMGYFSQENPPMDPEMRVIDFVKEIGNSIETAEGRVTASQSSFFSRRTNSGLRSGNSQAGSGGGFFSSPFWLRRPMCCCWMSPPMTWISRPSPSWRIIWRRSLAR